jgi:hypothetical protein
LEFKVTISPLQRVKEPFTVIEGLMGGLTVVIVTGIELREVHTPSVICK